MSGDPIEEFSQTLRRKIAGIREMMAFSNGLGIVFDRLIHPQSRLCVYRIGKLEVAVDRRGGDLASIRTCLATPMYRSLFDKMSLPKKISVLDLGANVGGFSLLLADLGYEFTSLVAVELNPNTALRLEVNLIGNLRAIAERIHVQVAGVSAAEDVLPAQFGWGSTGDSIEIVRATETTKSSSVPLTTLDKIIASQFDDGIIDVCKLDVEGAEHAIFSSGTHSRVTQVRYLIIEIHHMDDEPNEIVVSAINRAGFELIEAGPASPDRIYLFRNVRCES